MPRASRYFADAAAARAFAEIGLAAIFAGEKALGEAEIGDDADLFPDAESRSGPSKLDRS